MHIPNRTVAASAIGQQTRSWSVGTSSGTGIGGYRLSVSRHYEFPDRSALHHHVIKKGDHDGKMFPDYESAMLFAYERGYTQEYTPRTWCPVHRILHRRARLYPIKDKYWGDFYPGYCRGKYDTVY